MPGENPHKASKVLLTQSEYQEMTGSPSMREEFAKFQMLLNEINMQTVTQSSNSPLSKGPKAEPSEPSRSRDAVDDRTFDKLKEGTEMLEEYKRTPDLSVETRNRTPDDNGNNKYSQGKEQPDSDQKVSPMAPTGTRQLFVKKNTSLRLEGLVIND